jgi:hypothetical protein
MLGYVIICIIPEKGGGIMIKFSKECIRFFLDAVKVVMFTKLLMDALKILCELVSKFR